MTTLDDMIERWHSEALRHRARPRPVRLMIDGYRHVRYTTRSFVRVPPWARAKWYWQRARRGWADSDVWSFDHFLASVAAPALRKMADDAHGYPHDMTFEEWKDHLYGIADALEAYHRSEPAPDIAVFSSTPAYHAAVSAYNEREDERYREAVRAMHRLADHFGALWD